MVPRWNKQPSLVAEFSWCDVMLYLMMPETELSLPHDIMLTAGNRSFSNHSCCVRSLARLQAYSADMNMYPRHHQASPRNEAVFIVGSDL